MVTGKVAVVTGGTRGIGYAIARQMVAEGCALAILGTSAAAKVSASLAELRTFGCPVLYYRGNLDRADDRQEFTDFVYQELGRVDYLVNNAGVAPLVRQDLLEMSEESFDRVLGVNLKGTFFLTQRVAQKMVGQVSEGVIRDPVIVNISSVSAYASSPNRGEYCISKAGLGMVTKLFAHRLAEYGIRVYEVRPGVIATSMTEPVKDKYDQRIADGLTPVRRWGVPQDIADAVSLLCSGKLTFCTGQVLDVDGGFHIQRL